MRRLKTVTINYSDGSFEMIVGVRTLRMSPRNIKLYYGGFCTKRPIQHVTHVNVRTNGGSK